MDFQELGNGSSRPTKADGKFAPTITVTYAIRQPGESEKDFRARWQRNYRSIKGNIINSQVQAKRKSNPEKARAAALKWSRNNAEKVKASQKRYREINKASLYQKQCEWRAKNPDKVLAQRKRWHSENKDSVRAQQRAYLNNRLKTDPAFRLKHYLKSRVREAIHAAGTQKAAKTLALLGCTILEFRAHLEKQFIFPMCWDNYGSYWHVDHIRPLASFDLTDPEQQKIAFHYTNCQPLEGTENLRKGDKY